jgi:hypothetical protein
MMMKRSSGALGLALSLVAFGAASGCSKGDEAGAGGLAALSGDEQKAFEGWKSSLFKDCSASSALGASSRGGTSERGVDVDLMEARIGAERILRVGSDVVFVGGTNSIAGISRSKHSIGSSISVNGNSSSRSIEVEAIREGSSCKVSIGGQTVYEGRVAANYELLMHVRASSGDDSPDVGSSALRTAGSVASADGSAVAGALRSAVAPSAETIQLVGSSLGLTEESSRSLFRTSRLDSSYEAMRLNGTLWFNSGSPQLLGNPQNILAAGTRRAEIKLFGKTVLRNLEADLQLNQIQPDKYEVLVRQVRYLGSQAHDPQVFKQCFVDRTYALAQLASAPMSREISPRVREALSPCEPLVSEDGMKLAESMGALAEALPIVLAARRPSPELQYNGWDDVLFRLVITELRAGRNPRISLDPNSKAPLIGLVSSRIQSLYETIETNPAFNPVRDAVYRMGLSWALTNQNVSWPQTQQILRAVENTAVKLQASTLRLIDELSRSPVGQEQTLAFAASLDASYKNEVTRVLQIAEKIQYSTWINQIYSRILQNRTLISEIRTAGEKMARIETALSVHGGALSGVRERLVNSTMALLDRGTIRQDEVTGLFGAIANTAGVLPESTVELVNSLDHSGVEYPRAAVDFAASITAEYKNLVRAIRSTLPALEVDESALRGLNLTRVLQDQVKIERIREINSGVQAGVAFTQRERSRLAGENFTYSNERNRKEIIEQALKEGWSAADYETLEKVSEFGRVKTSCDRHKGISSVADCIGLRSFGRERGKFMAPEYGNRYSGLADRFRSYLQQMGTDFGYSSIRRQLIDTFFGTFEIAYSKCDTPSFVAKANALDAAVQARLKASNFSARYDAEKAIEAALKNCP